jgi:hypothetical protein
MFKSRRSLREETEPGKEHQNVEMDEKNRAKRDVFSVNQDAKWRSSRPGVVQVRPNIEGCSTSPVRFNLIMTF